MVEPVPSFTIFCDEAGNSGGNLLDEAQPVYVLGGWVIEDAKIGLLEAVITKEAAQVSGGSELHAVSFLKTRRG